MNAQPLTQHDVERMLMRLSSELEHATEQYAALCRSAAEADADAKYALHVATVRLADGMTRDTVDVRKSRAWLAARDEERAAAITTAARDATREQLRSLTTRIDALRTIAANVRAQT